MESNIFHSVDNSIRFSCAVLFQLYFVHALYNAIQNDINECKIPLGNLQRKPAKNTYCCVFLKVRVLRINKKTTGNWGHISLIEANILTYNRSSTCNEFQ